MATYLLPTNRISVKQKQQIFAIRNGMIPIHQNFPNMNIDPSCLCDLPFETNEHIYKCGIFINIEACPASAAASLLPSLVTNFASPKGIEKETK